MTDTDNTTFDYALDERQRHMLEAMGIKLWLPDASAREIATPALPTSAAVPARSAAAAPA